MKRPLLFTFLVIFFVATFVWIARGVGARPVVHHIEIGLLIAMACFILENSRRPRKISGVTTRSHRPRPAPNGLEPIILSHSLHGWHPSGPNCFRWQGDHLTCGFSPDRPELTPTTAQWEEFWRVCDEIDVWSWPPITGPVIFDGLSFTTGLEVGSRRLLIGGHVDNSPPGFETKLMRLHRALQALAGWHPPNEEEWRKEWSGVTYSKYLTSQLRKG